MTENSTPTDHLDELSQCPPLVELAGNLSDPEPAIQAHLESCASCRSAAAELPKIATSGPPPKLARAATGNRAALSDNALRPGEIVTVRNPHMSGDVLVAFVLDATGSAVVQVAPITVELGSLTEWDVLLPRQTPLGYEAAVDLATSGWIEIADIYERFGVCGADVAEVRARQASLPLKQPSQRPLARLDDDELARRFYVTVLSDLLAASPVVDTLDRELEAAGWSPPSLAALHRNVIDHVQRGAEERVVALLAITGWSTGGTAIPRKVAVDALTRAVKNGEPHRPSGVASVVSSAMAVLHLARSGGARPTAEEFVERVLRRVDGET
jgi:hypothetical protein